VTRFVIDCETLLRIAAGEIEVSSEHTLLAPTLVRSQALAALYEAASRGEISAAEGIDRLMRINGLGIRYLGDKVLQRTAWKVEDQPGWPTTYDAEFVALTQLQADALVTSNDVSRAGGLRAGSDGDGRCTPHCPVAHDRGRFPLTESSLVSPLPA